MTTTAAAVPDEPDRHLLDQAARRSRGGMDVPPADLGNPAWLENLSPEVRAKAAAALARARDNVIHLPGQPETGCTCPRPGDPDYRARNMGSCPACQQRSKEARAETAALQRQFRHNAWQRCLATDYVDYAHADLAELRPEQDPGGKVSNWLDTDSRTLILVGENSRGKCVDAESVIYDPDTGLPHRIEDIVNKGVSATVWTATEHGKITTLPITYRVDSGTKPTLRVTTATGRSIIVTPHHPLLLPEGWRRTDEITVGETIALPARLPGPRVPVLLSDEEVDLLALLVAEGNCNDASTSGGRTVSFTTSDPEMLRRATAAAEALGMKVQHLSRYDYALRGVLARPGNVPAGFCECGCGQKTNVFTKDNTKFGHVKGEAARFIRSHSADKSIARAFVRRHGIATLAKHKRMPDAVYRLDEKGLRRFLSILWMADGYVSLDAGPQITLASEALVRAIQHLLLRIGVQSSITYAPKSSTPGGKKHDAWRLHVLSSSRKTFADMLDLWGMKAQRAAQLAERPSSHRGHGAISSNPKIRARLSAVAKELGLSKRPGISISYTRNGRAMLHRNAVETLAPHASDLAHLISPDLFWDKVVSIEPMGQRKVYDLTVEPTACFIAEDIVVHNTHAAFAVANEAAKRDLWVVAWNAADFHDALRPGGDPRALEYAERCDVFLYDDMGAEKVTEAVLKATYQLFDARVRNRRKSMISTNLPYDERGFADTPPEQRPVRPNLIDLYGGRVVHRIMHEATVVRVLGDSFRKPVPW